MRLPPALSVVRMGVWGVASVSAFPARIRAWWLRLFGVDEVYYGINFDQIERHPAPSQVFQYASHELASDGCYFKVFDDQRVNVSRRILSEDAVNVPVVRNHETAIKIWVISLTQ